ncbi:MAG: hypothetical protein C0418_04430 [Coriobacteriaceae bacterium]|nr:hypothetical protein [Coriobacteriaceae bacterium]
MLYVFMYLFGAAVGILLALAAALAPGRMLPARWTFVVTAALMALVSFGCYLRFSALTGIGLGTANGEVLAWVGFWIYQPANAFMTPAMLIFAYTYTRRRLPHPAVIASLAAVGLLRLGLHATNPTSHLLSAGMSVHPTIAGHVTPLGWAELAVGYAIALAAIYVLCSAAWNGRTSGGRRQAVVFGLAAAVPLLGGLFSDVANPRVGFSPDLGIGLLWVLGVAFAVELFRYGFIDVLPSALASVVDDISEAVLVLNADRRVAEANHHARELFPDAAPGVPAGELLEDLGGTWLLSRDSADFEARVEGRSLLVQMSRLPRQAAPPRGWVVLVADITARKRVEHELAALNAQLEKRLAELQEARALSEIRRNELEVANVRLVELQDTKDRFLANVSHELRTPLNSVIGFSGVMLSGAAGDLTEEQERQLGMIKRSGEHLLSLINDILDLARIEAGRLRLESAEMDLAEVAADAVQRLRPQADEKGLALRTDGDAPVMVSADVTRVRQIALNLVGNAVKFTEAGSIAVRARSVDGHGVLEVVDTGPGIPPDRLEHIFDRFEQVGEHAGKPAGAGLGLSIARELARMLGGDIEVESEPGAGSTFRLVLPARV